MLYVFFTNQVKYVTEGVKTVCWAAYCGSACSYYSSTVRISRFYSSHENERGTVSSHDLWLLKELGQMEPNITIS